MRYFKEKGVFFIPFGGDGGGMKMEALRRPRRMLGDGALCLETLVSLLLPSFRFYDDKLENLSFVISFLF